MEGRWTVTVDTHGDLTDLTCNYPSDVEVPVVPCDDAAVDRATAFAVPLLSPLFTADGARTLVEAIFRAAGEQP